jgi:hypothetical protein
MSYNVDNLSYFHSPNVLHHAECHPTIMWILFICHVWYSRMEKTTDLVTDRLHHIMLCRVHLACSGFECTTLVVIGTDCIDSFQGKHQLSYKSRPRRPIYEITIMWILFICHVWYSRMVMYFYVLPVFVFDLLCLTPLSSIFQLYRGDQF